MEHIKRDIDIEDPTVLAERVGQLAVAGIPFRFTKQFDSTFEFIFPTAADARQADPILCPDEEDEDQFWLSTEFCDEEKPGWYYFILIESSLGDGSTETVASCGPYHSEQEANDNGELELARQIQSMG